MKRAGDERPWAVVLIAVSMAAMFGLDLSTSLGLSVWVLYFIPLALSLFTSRPLLPVALGFICTALLALGYAYSPPPPVEALVTAARVNRSLGGAVLIALGFAGRQLISAKMRIALKDWIDQGQVQLSAKMLGERDVSEQGRRVLSFLAEYLGAQVGSLYVGNGNGSFVRVAGHGLESLDPRSEVVAAGQTLVGQAAADGRAVLLNDLPDGYIDVRSGIGAAKPRTLCLLPTSADGAVNGVIELGFFSAPPKATGELLDTVASSVGMVIRSAQYRQRQAELLEETQRQAEELQVQHEELQTANEELESHQEALKTSQVELEETNGQLEEQARTLELQKEHLASTQDVLRKRATEVERASGYKSEFLANMSHELRTPLNSALILAKLLLDNKQGNLTDEQVQYAANIYSAGNDLLTLINDILDLSKVEAGKLELTIEPLDLGKLFEAAKQRFAPLAREKQLDLTVALEPGCPERIETDSVRLQQIITNLLSNAVKFTERGTVRLRARAGEQDDVLVSVEDTGIGIPAHQHQVIFDAFRQADGTTNRKYGGTGLGLSISRELVELLGGELRVESTPAEGSVFTVALPVRARKAALRRRGGHFAESPNDGRGAERRSLAPVDDDRAALSDPSRVVLVIEDDVGFARILRELAHELRFQCLLARSAEEGLVLAKQYKPAAILLDIGLPDHSGLTVLELLKRDASARHIPIHIVSAHDYQQVARELGAIGYALKPVKRDELMVAFRRLEEQLARQARSVLIVEDQDVQREAITKLLGSDGVSITSVATAEAGLERLEAERFDCVVLDLMLPGTSGFDFLDRVAKSDQTMLPPVIVYTARALTVDEEQRLRHHAKSIIIKGARSPERLLEEVTLFLHQSAADLPEDKRQMLRTALDREAVFSGRRILIVEDDIRNIFALTSALEPKGAALEVARNGKEALEKLSDHHQVDLVLMDIMMPEMDGLTAMREIRKQPRLSGLPIIALTAKAMPDDRQQCLDAGANDYIAKPLDVEKLVSLCRVWMPR